MTITRRDILKGATALGFAALSSRSSRISASESATPLDVAYAGSMSSVMEGPIRAAALTTLQLELRGRAQGAAGLAQLIAGGSLHPDVFISVTPSPMQIVVRAGKAKGALAIARTEMVIAWSPKSRFASQFEAASKPGAATPWWQILQQPGLRFGRTDPITDPQGRNIIFVMQLAAKLYGQTDLVQRTLGPVDNPAQIFSEPSVQARLQSGQLDAASAYKIQPGPFHVPYLTLPAEINLGDPQATTASEDIRLELNGKTYRPEPLVYYAAALEDSSRKSQGERFVQWLLSPHTQAIFQRYDYDPPGNAPSLKV